MTPALAVSQETKGMLALHAGRGKMDFSRIELVRHSRQYFRNEIAPLAEGSCKPKT